MGLEAEVITPTRTGQSVTSEGDVAEGISSRQLVNGLFVESRGEYHMAKGAPNVARPESSQVGAFRAVTSSINAPKLLNEKAEEVREAHYLLPSSSKLTVPQVESSEGLLGAVPESAEAAGRGAGEPHMQPPPEEKESSDGSGDEATRGTEEEAFPRSFISELESMPSSPQHHVSAVELTRGVEQNVPEDSIAPVTAENAGAMDATGTMDAAGTIPEAGVPNTQCGDILKADGSSSDPLEGVEGNAT
ncbi:unnamed protein product, partial [Discosporangium mesarthrocarpum]